MIVVMVMMMMTVKLLFVRDVSQVNGRDMRSVSHQDAVKALVASNNEVIIEVSHDPQPPGLQVSPSYFPHFTLISHDPQPPGLQVSPSYIPHFTLIIMLVFDVAFNNNNNTTTYKAP